MTTQRRIAGVWVVLAGLLMIAGPVTSAQPPVEDPDVEQAQFVRPAGPPGPATASPAPRSLPPIPPTPAVQLIVLVPQDAPPKAELTYTIRVTNTTTADAYKVQVRMPLPEGTTFVKAEPKPDADNARPPAPATEFQWKFKSLGANASQSVQVTVKPKDDVREIAARAFVSFEHGQQVTTKINPPKLKVRTDAPKQGVVGSPIPVRVTVTNEGRVPIQNVKLNCTIPNSCEFDRDASGDPVKGDKPQRVWEIGTLPPGATKQINYRISSKLVEEVLIQSAAVGSHESQVIDHVKVAVKEAKLRIELKGDGEVTSGEAAAYEAVVYNSGSLPLTNVRVTAQLPDGCKVTKMTNGGKENRDQLVWVIPKLPPDDKPYSVRWQLTSVESGRKTIRAAAVASQGVEHSQDVSTIFKGSAAPHWDATFDQAAVPVDRSGMLTIKVTNNGSEIARNARVLVSLPNEVRLLTTTPKGEAKQASISFSPVDIGPGKSVTYSLQFRGEQTGSAHFQMSLSADAIENGSLRMSKYVEITRR